MNWRVIKSTRFELESRGYFVESVSDKYIIVSKLDDDSGKLYYVYPGVRNGDGLLRLFLI